MGLFAKFFGSKDVVSKTVDAAIRSGDALFYTDEEKAGNELKRQELHIRMLAAYEPFKLLQRFLVLLFCVPYVVLHTVIIVLGFFELDYTHLGEQINEAFGYVVVAAVSLYLSGGSIFKRSEKK